MDKEIRFNLPDENEPGFLRRQKHIIGFMRKLKGLDEDPDETVIDDMVAFLVPFVESQENAEDLLWNLTQQQFFDVLESLAGMRNDADEGPVPKASE